MDVYRQAAEIVALVRDGHGTAKALCLRKEMQKKKQTYAVVCETLRHYELLEDVLEVAEFYKYYPQANTQFAICMAYDAVLGKGVHTNNDSTARAVVQSTPYLREAYWRVHKHHIIAPRPHDVLEHDAETNTSDDNGHQRCTHNGAISSVHRGDDCPPARVDDRVQRIPRYARVNTLKVDADTLVMRLQRSCDRTADDIAAHSSRRQAHHLAKTTPAHAPETAGAETSLTADSTAVLPSSASPPAARRRGVAARVLPRFTIDPVVPSLLVFPAGTDLHAHPAVRMGQLILQDRASCLPACVLLDAVEVRLGVALPECGDGGGGGGEAKAHAAARPALEYVIDACAAPGNKTTHLAALGAPRIKIMATERDERRAELLQARVTSLGAGDYVNVVHMDFLDLDSDDRLAAEAILLDPSCSASGMFHRVDVQQQQRQSTQTHGGHAKRLRAQDEKDDAYTGAEAQPRCGVAVESVEDAAAERVVCEDDRVAKLARVQRKLLTHALLSFDNCRTVVYSTCSVHCAENEDVVRQVLSDERVTRRGWRLSCIMPTQWTTRGMCEENDTIPLHHTIRCDVAKDATSGFYIARFDRLI